MTRSPTARARRLGSAGLGVLVLALVGSFAVRENRPETAPAGEPAPVLSLLAVGDTGTPPGWIRAFDGQSAVGFIDVADDHVRLEVQLPWLLAVVAEKLTPAIRKEGTLMLEKK